MDWADDEQRPKTKAARTPVRAAVLHTPERPYYTS
jgi:hypothetical protein